MTFSIFKDMHQIHELLLTLMTWWFQPTDLFQNELMPLLHGPFNYKDNMSCAGVFILIF